jgi:serine acetyltransferase
MDATIMPNVEIGDNSIISAGSVVFKSVPENSVVMGNPASIVFKTSLYLKMKKYSKFTIANERFPSHVEAPYEVLREFLEKNVPSIPNK